MKSARPGRMPKLPLASCPTKLVTASIRSYRVALCRCRRNEVLMGVTGY